MKKSTIVLTIVGTVLMVVFGVLCYFGPNLFQMTNWHTAHPLAWEQIGKYIAYFFTADYWTSWGVQRGISKVIGLCGLVINVGLWISALVVMICRKRKVGLVMFFVWLVEAVIFQALLLCVCHPEVVFSNLTFRGPFGVISEVWHMTNQTGKLLVAVFGFTSLGMIFIGWCVSIAGIVRDMATGKKLKVSVAEDVPACDKVEEFAVEELPTEEAVMNEEFPVEDVAPGEEAPVEETPVAEEPQAEETKEEPKEEPAPAAVPQQGQTPVVVQYINTYPADAVAGRHNVPVSEIQGNISSEKALTAEDIRKIVREEMGPKEEKAPVIVAVPENKSITAEDVRAIIADELAKNFKKPEEVVADKKENVQAVVAEAPKAEPAVTATDIRQIINEEFARREVQTSAKDELTPEMIREIIRSEVVPVPAVKEEKVTPVTVVVTPEVKTVAPKAQPKPAVVPAPAATANEPKDKIVRIPFQTRIKSADKEMKNNYNELKSEIMSYGVKSRISNKGDTFRLHKITFVKITIAGKSLKLYFALDPKDYKNSTIPVQDASDKSVYKDIPLVFKVKSELSMRRAKELIATVMEKNNVEQGKVEPKNWVKEVPAAKENGEDAD